MSAVFFFLLCRLTVFDLAVRGYIRGLWGGDDVDEGSRADCSIDRCLHGADS